LPERLTLFYHVSLGELSLVAKFYAIFKNKKST
jgi:hypothetical protein